MGKQSRGGRRAEEVRDGMDVIGHCGGRLGVVESVEGSSLRLAGTVPHEEDHYLPLEWVARVDDGVHLGITCAQAREELCAAPVGAGV